MNTEEFSEALDDALPPQPVSKGWGAKARRRRRNRRTAGVTGVVGVVAVAVFAVTAQLTGQQTMTATPAPADPSQQEPTPLFPEVCQGLDEIVHPDELPDDGRMPEGAEEVWLCGGKGLGSWGDLPLVGAAEPLTLDVDAAVAAFNAEPTATMAIDCDGLQSEMFDVVYAYPDGTRYVAQVLRGRSPEVGCNHVTVGGWLRFEPQEFMAELTQLWQQQRDERGSSFVPGVDVCPDMSSVFDVSPNQAVSGFVCALPDGGSGEVRQVRLSDELVADIAAEIEVTGDGPEPGLDRSAPSLVLHNEHGDPFTIFGTPDDGYHWYPPRDAGGMQIWTPSPDIRDRMLAEISRGLDPHPSAPPTTTATSAAPSTTPQDSTTPSTEPSQAIDSQPPTPPEPDPAATGSTDAYTDAELQYAMRVLLNSLNGQDPREFSAVVSRATFRDAWNIASSDVWLAEYPLPDDAPVLVVRIRGPVEAAGGAPSLTPGPQEPPQGAGLLVILDTTTGAGVSGGATYLVRSDGQPAGPPPVDPNIESDVVQLTIPDPGGTTAADLQLRAAQECRVILSDSTPGPAGTTLPDEPSEVWLCLAFAPTLTGPGWAGYGLLTDADNSAQAAVDAFNSLTAGAECVGGWGGAVAFDYPDGSRHVATVTDQSVHEPGGCIGVTLGDLHLDGAADYVSQLRTLWETSIGTR